MVWTHDWYDHSETKLNYLVLGSWLGFITFTKQMALDHSKTVQVWYSDPLGVQNKIQTFVKPDIYSFHFLISVIMQNVLDNFCFTFGSFILCNICIAHFRVLKI